MARKRSAVAPGHAEDTATGIADMVDHQRNAPTGNEPPTHIGGFPASDAPPTSAAPGARGPARAGEGRGEPWPAPAPTGSRVTPGAAPEGTGLEPAGAGAAPRGRAAPPAAAPEPEPTSAAEGAAPAEGAEPDDTGDQPLTVDELAYEIQSLRTALAERDQREQLLHRELELMRQGAQPVQPGQPGQAALSYQTILPWTIDGRVMEMLGLAPEAAPVLDAILRSAIWGAVQQVGTQWVGPALTQQQAQVHATLQQQQLAQQINTAFWTANDDLAPYGELVRLVSEDLMRREGTQLTPALWMQKTSQVVRAQLRSHGISVAPLARSAGASAAGVAAPGARPGGGTVLPMAGRLRPAGAEGGGGGGHGTRPALTPVQREIDELMAAARR